MDTKNKKRTCYKCKEDKKITEFKWDNKKEKKRGYICKKCHTIHQKDRNITPHQRTKARNRNRLYKQKRQKENKEFLINYLKENPCIECGESDIIVLEFDHIESDKKFKNISVLRKHYNLKILKKEIEKCQVLCANCHRKKTARQFGWEELWNQKE